MIYEDITKLPRRHLMEYLERERQEWLSAGMSEADIFRVHFGEPNESGRSGDYRVWLDERKHTRPDRKYAPGAPVAIDMVDPDGAWISGGQGGLDDAEFGIVLETALSKLTEFQRTCFVEVVLNERSYTNVASHFGKHHSTIQEAVRAAKAKLKKFFS